MAFIVVSAKIKKPIKEVWEKYTNPDDVVNWNFAADTWYCPKAKNDLRTGGRFAYMMSAKDKSYSFNFSGTFIEVEKNNRLVYRMDDDRYAIIRFTKENNGTNVEISFEAETENSTKLQKQGWQAILNNFKKYTENKKGK
jgi:uncharacterized protein YndB with AHSA1/START domain